jgi:hypothetical protein
MIFKRETDYNSVSAEGYRISLARLGGGRIAYTAWFAKKPLGECQIADASQPADRDAAFFRAKVQCSEHHARNRRVR